MGISKINKWEQAVVLLLNIDGWDLKWTGEGFAHYDAAGKTPKGFDCVIEMKFRNKYYEDKMLEKYKYDALMSLDESIIKLYFINDPKGNFIVQILQCGLKKDCLKMFIYSKKTKQVESI